MPKVSIIIPVYNTAPYLERCIRSCFQQTYPDIEIIAVNDASTDPSFQILTDLGLDDSRLKILQLYENSGESAARIEAIRKATGQYIFFIDSDDWLEEDQIATLVQVALAEGTDLVISGFNNIINGVKTKGDQYSNRKLNREEYFLALLNGEIYATIWAKLFKRSLWVIDANNLDTSIRLHPDQLMNFMYADRCTQISIIEYIGYNYNRRGDSTINTLSPSMAHDIFKVVTKILDLFKSNNLFETHFSAISRFCAIQLATAIHININVFRNPHFASIFRLANPSIGEVEQVQMRILLRSYGFGIPIYRFISGLYAVLRNFKQIFFTCWILFILLNQS